MNEPPLARQSTVVAIGARAVLVEGAPGSGKSALALALMDRGARLVGDDSVMLEVAQARLVASPHPATCGLLEVRGLGLVPFPVAGEVPVALAVTLDPGAPRFVEGPGMLEILGCRLPHFTLAGDAAALALKVELALERFGIAP